MDVTSVRVEARDCELTGETVWLVSDGIHPLELRVRSYSRARTMLSVVPGGGFCAPGGNAPLAFSAEVTLDASGALVASVSKARFLYGADRDVSPDTIDRLAGVVCAAVRVAVAEDQRLAAISAPALAV